MYRGWDQEEVTRRQDSGIWSREVGAQNIGIWGGKMYEALTFSEKELAPGQESPGSEGVRAGEA